MIKIAIADDEKMIREGIRDTFNWDEAGFEVVGLCKNGEEALNLSRQAKPDIFLLDICMPKINGLDLIEQIRAENPRMLFIIITGYSEFEYAHRAIGLGVYDFVVKPIDESKLWHIIIGARDVLISDRVDTNKNAVMKKQISIHLKSIQSDFVNKLVTKGYDDEVVIEEELSNLELTFGQKPALILLRHISHVSSKKNWSDQLLNFAYKNLIVEMAEKIGPTIIITKDIEDQIVALIGVEDVTAWENFPRELEEATRVYLGQQTRVETCYVDGNLMDCVKIYKKLDALLNSHLSDNVLSVKRIIENEYSDSDLELNLIANRLAVSNSHLSRQIQKELGISFKEYLISQRMAKAKELVGKSDLRFNEIAEMIGYANQHYFTRSFKKVTGMSPSQYRANR